MLAPVDAKATFEADGATYTLQMNWRTIALAEDVRPDCVTAFGGGKPTLSALSALVWGFAQPAHPDLSLDDALGLMIRHSEAVGTAVRDCFEAATKGAGADAGKDPPKAARSK